MNLHKISIGEFEKQLAAIVGRPTTLRPFVCNGSPLARAVIECLAGELGHTTYLETNIYATAAEDYSDLRTGLRDTEPFDYLLATLKPEVIIVHGADAVAHVQSKAPAATVLAVPHFSRGWSHESARDLGRKVKQMIGEWTTSNSRSDNY